MLVTRSEDIVVGGAIAVEDVSVLGTSEIRFMPALGGIGTTGGIGTPNEGIADFEPGADGSARPKPATTVAGDGAKVIPASPEVSAVL